MVKQCSDMGRNNVQKLVSQGSARDHQGVSQGSPGVSQGSPGVSQGSPGGQPGVSQGQVGVSQGSARGQSEVIGMFLYDPIVVERKVGSIDDLDLGRFTLGQVYIRHEKIHGSMATNVEQ